MRNVLFKICTSGAVGCLLVAVPLCAYCVVKNKLKHKAHATVKARNSFFADMTAVGGNVCACCGGENTHLLPIANDEWQCSDRKLCRETMIYTHMLKGLESA